MKSKVKTASATRTRRSKNHEEKGESIALKVGTRVMAQHPHDGGIMARVVAIDSEGATVVGTDQRTGQHWHVPFNEIWIEARAPKPGDEQPSLQVGQRVQCSLVPNGEDCSGPHWGTVMEIGDYGVLVRIVKEKTPGDHHLAGKPMIVPPEYVFPVPAQAPAGYIFPKPKRKAKAG